ncbi:MAG: CRP-like cAMP-binding protein/bacterioferritin-associated ferredoxin [Myxococcota bacterium]|jgi:CRP-like cAMP-binding protein/bacterioferritin-associated ferredoxin
MTTLTAEDRARTAELPIIKRLGEAQADAVLADAVAIELPPGEQIVRQGDIGDVFFLLLEGQLEVYLDGNDGEEIRLAVLEPGAYFGERALMNDTDNVRTANVRTLNTCRCAAISRDTFLASVAGEPANRQEFDQASAASLHNDLLRSLDAFRGLELDAATIGEVSRHRFSAGEAVLSEGDPADAVYFVLDGVALAIGQRDGNQETLRRIGSGQCFGELGVLHDKPRSATVRAETALEVLRIEAAAFRVWVEAHPQLRDFLGTLETVYPLQDGRTLSVYRGDLLGRPAISTVHGDPAGNCLISAKIIGEDLVVIAQAGAVEAGDDEVVYIDPTSGRETTLYLTDVTFRSSGAVSEGRLIGVMATAAAVRTDDLYRKVLHREMVSSTALKRFRASGCLGRDVPAGDALICKCMGVRQKAILSAAATHGYTLEAVRSSIGAGIICGSCTPDVTALLAAERPEGAVEQEAGFGSAFRRGLKKIGFGRKP